MGLKECIARDIDKVFLNTADFCDNICIQIGTTKFNVIGSLQSNTIQNNSGNNQPLQDISYTLYIKYPLLDSTSNKLLSTDALSRAPILSAGARIMIDNKSFTIVNLSDEMGIATIQLTTRVGR